MVWKFKVLGGGDLGSMEFGVWRIFIWGGRGLPICLHGSNGHLVTI